MKKQVIWTMLAVFFSSLMVVIAVFITSEQVVTVEEPPEEEITETAVSDFSCNAFQARIYDLHSQYREAIGISPLIPSPTLIRAAKLKAADMLDMNTGHVIYWEHENPLDDTDQEKEMETATKLLTAVGYKFVYAGENMAKDFDFPDAMFESWVNSEDHLSNVIDTHYDEIGVYTACDSESKLTIVLFGNTQ